MREASHGVDGLVGQVIVGGGIILDQLALLHLVTLSDSVDLLVDLSPVMVALLSSSGHSVLDPAGMPSSNTSDLDTSMKCKVRNLFESVFSLLSQTGTGFEVISELVIINKFRKNGAYYHH